ncbi:MAG: pyrroloquinoline quinone-dependent dehydrogenase, partial [Gammaproteobacteria bacterium]
MNRMLNTLLAVALGACTMIPAAVAQAQSDVSTGSSQWPTYGGNLASHRYAPLEQIDAGNFGDLEIAWRLRTDFLGPRPDTLYSATPLYVNDRLYTTAGRRRAAIALDPASGEMLWMHSEQEGARGDSAARGGAGRGLAYWSNNIGSDKR